MPSGPARQQIPELAEPVVRHGWASAGSRARARWLCFGRAVFHVKHSGRSGRQHQVGRSGQNPGAPRNGGWLGQRLTAWQCRRPLGSEVRTGGPGRRPEASVSRETIASPAQIPRAREAPKLIGCLPYRPPAVQSGGGQVRSLVSAVTGSEVLGPSGGAGSGLAGPGVPGTEVPGAEGGGPGRPGTEVPGAEGGGPGRAGDGGARCGGWRARPCREPRCPVGPATGLGLPSVPGAPRPARVPRPGR